MRRRRGRSVEQSGKAARENDGDRQARCENELGTISWRQGEYDQAGEEHIAALSQLAISGISNPKIEIEANYGLGLLYRQRGNYGEAQNQFVKCLQLNQKINNRQFEARILNALGVVEDLQRNFQSAINYYEQALVIREAIGDRAGVGASMLNIAQSLGSMGLHDKAEGMLLNTIRLQKSIGSIWWQANTWNTLGMLYLLVGNLQEARISLETGIKLSQQIGQKNTQAYLLCNLGQVLRDLGQLEQARSVLLTALDMAFSQGDVQLEAICLNDLALTNIQQKNFSQAIQQANQSLEKFQTLGVELSITSNMALLATAYLALEENGKALHYANETIGILDRCDGEGPDYPQRDYFTCFLVYQKIGENNRAIHALSEAKRLLEKQATQISDPVMRHCFLENIPYHRSIRSITQTFGL